MRLERTRKDTNARHKAAGERKVFQAFLDALDWPCGSVTSETPPAPDVLYKPLNGTPLAFELGELVDEGFVQAINELNKPDTDPTPAKTQDHPYQVSAELFVFSHLQSTLATLLNKKLSKKYQSPYPIHLLMYWAGRSALLQDSELNWMQDLCSLHATDAGPFDAIWYWGGECLPIQIWSKGCVQVEA